MLAGVFAGFECKECDAYLKNRRGCGQPGTEVLFGELPGYGEVAQCPLSIIPEEVYEVLRVYQGCRIWGEFGVNANGLLPSTGGIMDLPAILIDAFSVLDSTLNEAILELRRQERRKNG